MPFGANLMRSQVLYQAAQGTDRQTIECKIDNSLLWQPVLSILKQARSSIPATRNATVNKLLCKLWEPEPEPIPKSYAVAYSLRACWS